MGTSQCSDLRLRISDRGSTTEDKPGNKLRVGHGREPNHVNEVLTCERHARQMLFEFVWFALYGIALVFREL